MSAEETPRPVDKGRLQKLTEGVWRKADIIGTYSGWENEPEGSTKGIASELANEDLQALCPLILTLLIDSERQVAALRELREMFYDNLIDNLSEEESRVMDKVDAALSPSEEKNTQ